MNEELTREQVLLKAAYDILKKCHDSGYLLDPLEETAFYDGTDCDGLCLVNDIAEILDLDEVF